MAALELLSEVRCFGGRQLRVRHFSEQTQCDMVFAIFLPAQAEQHEVPVLYWLSGLTCNDENFITKAGAQRYAAEHGIAIVAPDTSPRGDGVADDPEAGWDFGLGAGFYVDATEQPYAKHYRMYSYVSQELPAFVAEHFPIDEQRQGISGHSMGGHGAMTVALNNPENYLSVSAFAPICAPMQCPWGEKALAGYLGDDRSHWLAHDTCALIAAGAKQLPLLVDQGDGDSFLAEQLKPELLEAACDKVGYPLQLRMHTGYDHSYYFIASFIGDHIAFHAKYLNPPIAWEL